MGHLDPQKIKYVGYALQLLLVIVLVISLACKSWTLLGICLGATVVLLVLVSIQLLNQPDDIQNSVRLLKTMFAPAHQLPVQQLQVTQPQVYRPIDEPIYDPLQHVSRDERTALQIMSMPDATPSMHPAVQPMFNQRIVPTSQGADLHPQTDAYHRPVGQPETVPVHLDPLHPQNPLNSLSYLYKH